MTSDEKLLHCKGNSKKWKHNSLNGRRYSQMIYPIRCWYLKYIKMAAWVVTQWLLPYSPACLSVSPKPELFKANVTDQIPQAFPGLRSTQTSLAVWVLEDFCWQENGWQPLTGWQQSSAYTGDSSFCSQDVGLCSEMGWHVSSGHHGWADLWVWQHWA